MLAKKISRRPTMSNLNIAQRGLQRNPRSVTVKPVQCPTTEKVKLPAHPVKTGQARLGLPGNVNMITGSAFLPAPAYWQEGGASSRLARENISRSS
jgi:hypothetical protein